MLDLTSVSDEEYKVYADGVICPEEFYKNFYVLLKIFQVLDEPIPRWTYIPKAFMTLCASIALGCLSISFYHGVDNFDISFMTESGTYFLVMAYKLLILYCTKINLHDYHCLQRIIKEDFLFVCQKGNNFRERFFRNQIQTRKICKLAMIFINGVGLGMISFAIFLLMLFLATHNPEDEGKRPLLFPFWAFNIDFGATPTYEIAFMFSNVCVCAYAFNYSFMMITQVVWVREIACKADLIIWYIRELMDGISPTNSMKKKKYFKQLIQYRMSQVIKHHHSMLTLMEHYAKVYKKLLMFEQKVCGPVVCLSAYSFAEKCDAGEFNGILLLLCVATIILVFIPSYLCTFLSIKVSSISFACWDIPFWEADPVIRPYLVLLIQRAQRPLPLKTPGFDEVSVQTFSNKMSSAYSCFNMLRQANT